MYRAIDRSEFRFPMDTTASPRAIPKLDAYAKQLVRQFIPRLGVLPPAAATAVGLLDSDSVALSPSGRSTLSSAGPAGSDPLSPRAVEPAIDDDLTAVSEAVRVRPSIHLMSRLVAVHVTAGGGQQLVPTRPSRG